MTTLYHFKSSLMKFHLHPSPSPPLPHTVPAMILSGTVGFLWHYVFESGTVHTIDAVRKVCTQFLFVLDGCLLFLMYGDDDFYIFTQGAIVDSTLVEAIAISRNMFAYLYEVTCV